MIFVTSGANDRKPLSEISELYLTTLEPRPEAHQIETSGVDFIYFWSQAQKVIKSRLMGLRLGWLAGLAGMGYEGAGMDRGLVPGPAILEQTNEPASKPIPMRLKSTCAQNPCFPFFFWFFWVDIAENLCFHLFFLFFLVFTEQK